MPGITFLLPFPCPVTPKGNENFDPEVWEDRGFKKLISGYFLFPIDYSCGEID